MRLAFDPHREERLALAQGLDRRGFPTFPGYVLDLRTFEVTRALLSESGQGTMGVGGFAFLRDGRLVFVTTQVRRFGSEDRFGTCTLVLHVIADAEEVASLPCRSDHDR